MDEKWDFEVVSHLVLPVDVQLFLSMLIGFIERDDILVWHYDTKGTYMVRSGYRLAMKMILH